MLQAEDSFQNKQKPRDTVHEKIKPIYGAHQSALDQHLQLFKKMRRIIGSKPKGQTGNYQQSPGKSIQEFFHQQALILKILFRLSLEAGYGTAQGVKKSLQLVQFGGRQITMTKFRIFRLGPVEFQHLVQR